LLRGGRGCAADGDSLRAATRAALREASRARSRRRASSSSNIVCSVVRFLASSETAEVNVEREGLDGGVVEVRVVGG
jgi:hypothetical protein